MHNHSKFGVNSSIEDDDEDSAEDMEALLVLNEEHLAVHQSS